MMKKFLLPCFVLTLATFSVYADKEDTKNTDEEEQVLLVADDECKECEGESCDCDLA